MRLGIGCSVVVYVVIYLVGVVDVVSGDMRMVVFSIVVVKLF